MSLALDDELCLDVLLEDELCREVFLAGDFGGGVGGFLTTLVDDDGFDGLVSGVLNERTALTSRNSVELCLLIGDFGSKTAFPFGGLQGPEDLGGGLGPFVVVIDFITTYFRGDIGGNIGPLDESFPGGVCCLCCLTDEHSHSFFITVGFIVVAVKSLLGALGDLEIFGTDECTALTFPFSNLELFIPFGISGKLHELVL